MTLSEFLLARIAEDEAAALPFRNDLGDVKLWRADETGGAVRYIGPLPFGLPDLLATFDTHLEAAHVSRWDPARALAECAAKRVIMERHRPEAPDARGPICSACGDWWDGSPEPSPCDTLKALAAVYAAHPDYDPEWAL